MDFDDQHITWSEAEEVVRLHRQRIGMSEQISFNRLTEALGADAQSTRAMLAEVRDARRRQKRRVIDLGGILSFAIVGVLAAGYFGFTDLSRTSEPVAFKPVPPVAPKLLAKHAPVWRSITQYRVSDGG